MHTIILRMPGMICMEKRADEEEEEELDWRLER